MSTRSGGVSGGGLGMNLSYRVGDAPENVSANRLQFFEALGVSPASAAYPIQCHSNRVRIVHSPGEYPDCDALISAETGLALAVTVADCVPILLFDPVRRVAAAVHAGWRGTVGQIVALAVAQMIQECGANPGHIVAFIGPAAGACCYQVDAPVASQFPDPFVRDAGNGKYFPDLKRFNKAQLIAQGVPHAQIEIDSDCTMCNAAKYHSYRREGASSGRMLAVIQMKLP